MAWAWRDASWSSADVSHPPGIVHLWYARHFLVGSGAGRQTVPSAYRVKWRRVPVGSTGILGYRLHRGNAALVDDRRLYRLWRLGCGTAVVQFERLANRVMKPSRTNRILTIC